MDGFWKGRGAAGGGGFRSRMVSSDAWVLLLGDTDRAVGLTDRQLDDMSLDEVERIVIKSWARGRFAIQSLAFRCGTSASLLW